MEKMISVSVIVLNWNGEDLLREYVPNWIKTTNILGVDLVIVDNGSTDSSRDILTNEFPQVTTIFLDKNYGFAEGYNMAINSVSSDIVVLLNSDAEPVMGWLDEPIRIMSLDSSIVAIQPKILSRKNKKLFDYAGAAGGFVDIYGYPFCRGRIFSTIEQDLGQYDNSIDLFWASGAALIIRRHDYISLGGLDPRFFAHQEEIDLCWRIRARGGRIILSPNSIVFHEGGASLDYTNPRKTYLNFRNNLLMIYKNMPANNLKKVLFVRMFLDYLSAILYLSKFQWRNAFAVLRARRDYRKMKSCFVKDRRENINKTKILSIAEMRNYSIIWRYFFKGKRTFCSIDNIFDSIKTKRS